MDLICQIDGAKSPSSPNSSRLFHQLDIDFDSDTEQSPLIKDYSTRLIEFSASWQTPPYLVSPLKLSGPVSAHEYQSKVAEPAQRSNTIGLNSHSRVYGNCKQLVQNKYSNSKDN